MFPSERCCSGQLESVIFLFQNIYFCIYKNPFFCKNRFFTELCRSFSQISSEVQWFCKFSDFVNSDANLNPFMPTGAFNMCFSRDCVSRHNGGTRGSPIMPRDAVSRKAHIGTYLQKRNGGHKWVKYIKKLGLLITKDLI